MAYGIPKYRRIPLCGGTMAYNISIVEHICRPIGCPMTVTVDEKKFVGTYLMVTVANGMTYGGGYKAAPRAKLDDGLLDVLLVKKISRLRIASVVASTSPAAILRGMRLSPRCGTSSLLCAGGRSPSSPAQGDRQCRRRMRPPQRLAGAGAAAGRPVCPARTACRRARIIPLSAKNSARDCGRKSGSVDPFYKRKSPFPKRKGLFSWNFADFQRKKSVCS